MKCWTKSNLSTEELTEENRKLLKEALLWYRNHDESWAKIHSDYEKEDIKLERLSRVFQQDGQISNVKDFLDVVRWKSPRSLGYAKKNRNHEKLRQITRKAFDLASKEKLVEALKLLSSGELKGVGVRMATAMLMFYNPTKFTVLDVNVYRSLVHLKVLDSFDCWFENSEDYPIYLESCRRVSIWFRHNLRDTDRALWRLANDSLILTTQPLP